MIFIVIGASSTRLLLPPNRLVLGRREHSPREENEMTIDDVLDDRRVGVGEMAISRRTRAGRETRGVEI